MSSQYKTQVAIIFIKNYKIKIIKHLSMGAGKSKDNIYYDPTINSQLFDETKQCKFYRNHRGEQFEKYKVENKGQNDFENRYDYRIKNSSPYLVDAYSAKSAQNAFGCASGDQYEVVTERIPTRLFDLNNLSGKEALNITNKALKGFQQIYKSQGVLLVKDSMIGINKQNKVKVWMNSNFALNQMQEPPISYGVLPQTQKQSTMVDNIIQLVNSRSKKDPQWVQFVDDKYRQGRIGFDQAIKLTQAYAARHNLSMGDHPYTNQGNSQFVSSTINQYSMKGSDHPNSHSQKQPQVSSSYQPVENYQGSMLKSSNPTLNSSIPFQTNTSPMGSHFTPQFSSPQIRPSIQSQSTMSNLKNKIIHGGNQSNKIQNAPNKSRPISLSPISQPIQSTSIGFHPFPSTSIGSSLLPHASQNPYIENKTSISQLPSSLPPTQNKIHVPPIENRFTFNENQYNFKPRAASQGKPIVSFGGKPIISQQFPSMINNRSLLPSPSINYVASQDQTKAPLNAQTNVSYGQSSSPNVSGLPNFQPNRYFPQQNQSVPSPNISTSNQQLKQQGIQFPSQTIQSQSSNLTNVPPPQPMKLMYQNEANKQNQSNNKSELQQIGTFEQNRYIQSNQQMETNPYSMVGNSMPNLYPPPNQVVNFEKKIQITQSQYQNSVNNSVTHQSAIQPGNKMLPLNTNVKQVLGAIAGNLQSYRKSSQKVQKSQPIIVNAEQVHSYFDEPPQFSNRLNSNQVKKAQTFGENNSQAASLFQNTNNFNSFNNNASLAHSQEQKNTQYREIDTPMFDKARNYENKNEAYTLTFNKKLSAQSHQEDQMLAHEQEHLNMIKSNKAQNQASELHQSKKLEQSKKIHQSQKLEQSQKLQQSQKLKQSQKVQAQIKSDNSIRQSPKIQNQETDRHVNQAITKLSSSLNKNSGVKQKQAELLKQTPRESSKQVAKNDETIFKKGVRQTASNIRMQSSKISIRNSADLKGIISYKDLRDLLKTTRKYNH